MLLKESRNCDNYKDKKRAFYRGYDNDRYKPARWLTWQRFGNMLKHDLFYSRSQSFEFFKYYWIVLSERNMKKYGVLNPYKKSGGIRDEISDNIRDLVEPFPWLRSSERNE